MLTRSKRQSRLVWPGCWAGNNFFLLRFERPETLHVGRVWNLLEKKCGLKKKKKDSNREPGGGGEFSLFTPIQVCSSSLRRPPPPLFLLQLNFPSVSFVKHDFSVTHASALPAEITHTPNISQIKVQHSLFAVMAPGRGKTWGNYSCDVVGRCGKTKKTKKTGMVCGFFYGLHGNTPNVVRLWRSFGRKKPVGLKNNQMETVSRFKSTLLI